MCTALQMVESDGCPPAKLLTQRSSNNQAAADGGLAKRPSSGVDTSMA